MAMRTQVLSALAIVSLFGAPVATAADLGTCLNPIILSPNQVYVDPSQQGVFGITPAHQLVVFSKPLTIFGQAAYKAVPHPGHCKHAIIGYDWGDAGFTAEAQNVGNALAATGQWDVTYIDPAFVNAHPNDTSEIQLLLDAGNNYPSTPGDEILLDIQAHGAESENWFALPNGGSVGPITYTDSLADPTLVAAGVAPTIPYPYDLKDPTSPNYWPAFEYYETHWDTASINGNVLTAFASHFSSQDYLVTMIDHSCFAGSTSYLFEISEPYQINSNVCTITTDGVMTPGLVGFPAISGFMESQVQNGEKFSFDDVANYISQQYATNVLRPQSTGHKTSCNQTLALRDTMSLAGGAYSTFWDWVKALHSFVLRQPDAFVNEGTVGPVQPIDNYSREAIPVGWLRWYYASINVFYIENQFGAWVLGQEQAGTTANALVATTLSNGLAHYRDVVNEGTLITQFETDLSNSHVFPSYYPLSQGYTADAYLRSLLTNFCLCNNPSLVSQYGLTCDPTTTPFWPGNADGQTPWINSLNCSEPADVAAFVLGQTDNGAELSQELLSVQMFEQQTNLQAATSMLTSIQHFEEGCISPTCASQDVF
jgi:hypothetical protein